MNLKELPELLTGTAGEHLVCADVLLQGHRAFLAPQLCAYDVIIDVAGLLVRVQVKSTHGPRAVPQRESVIPAYSWNVKRAGKRGLRAYKGDEFDMLALVALDVRRIAYMSPDQTRQTVFIRSESNRRRPRPDTGMGKTFEAFPLASALETLIGRSIDGATTPHRVATSEQPALFESMEGT